MNRLGSPPGRENGIWQDIKGEAEENGEVSHFSVTFKNSFNKETKAERTNQTLLKGGRVLKIVVMAWFFVTSLI